MRLISSGLRVVVLAVVDGEGLGPALVVLAVSVVATVGLGVLRSRGR
ncbi:hypothetical protein LN042_25935 [Kitasatospora sp. RB6PN24]|nr:hypothetical protein [Kitasatospora humi]MCC9310468.1 hypothetical protein [Kitasatospora humi]